MKKYYITTPIFYPSDNLHIGHTYTTVAADTLKRFKKAQGYDAYFLTGTDEHGQKIQEMAEKNQTTPKAYVDGIVDNIKKLWDDLEIDYDKFVRTTDEDHALVVQKVFQKLYDQGDIYKAEYEGKYCVPCESFWSEAQLEEGMCPDCHREVEVAKEESYFFKLSKYEDRIKKLYKEESSFLEPESRKNEMVSNFLNEGLDDISISRTTLDWGIEVPFDQDHVVYVWIDALLCYISGLGYDTENDELYNKYWPADVHLVGKEIVRFHTIIWPAVLMALDLDLPKKVFGHGWILFDNDKMSKSKGNVIYPEPLIELYGIDAFKYFLMREFSFGQDGSFSKDKFIQRLNSDLANDLGNLVSRTTKMVEKYNGGSLPEIKTVDEELDASLIALAEGVKARVEAYMDKLNFSRALEEIWTLIRRTNKYIDETSPWVLASEGDSDRLDTVLYNLIESIRIIAFLINPFMEKTSLKILEQIGYEGELKWEEADQWGLIKAGSKVAKGEALFPRLDVDKEIKNIDQAHEDLKKARGIESPSQEKEEKEEDDKMISIDDFAKVEFKVGEILEANDHPDADKLLVFKVRVGEETRQIVSGIKKHYSGEELIGKKVVVVCNLKPVKLRGVESSGMLLAAEKDGVLTLVSTLEDIDSGAVIS